MHGLVHHRLPWLCNSGKECCTAGNSTEAVLGQCFACNSRHSFFWQLRLSWLCRNAKHLDIRQSMASAQYLPAVLSFLLELKGRQTVKAVYVQQSLCIGIDCAVIETADMHMHSFLSFSSYAVLVFLSRQGAEPVMVAIVSVRHDAPKMLHAVDMHTHTHSSHLLPSYAAKPAALAGQADCIYTNLPWVLLKQCTAFATMDMQHLGPQSTIHADCYTSNASGILTARPLVRNMDAVYRRQTGRSGTCITVVQWLCCCSYRKPYC